MRAEARAVCPICGREAAPRRGQAASAGAEASSGNPAFPFCSSACKRIDLGRWLDGGYRFPGTEIESSRDGDAYTIRDEKEDE